MSAVPTVVLAVLAIALTALSGGRWGIELFAWLAPIPWLLWVRRLTGWRGRVLLVLGAMLAIVLQFSTIITPPIPWLLAPGFGLPAGLALGLTVLGWDALRRATSDRLALYGFAVLMAVTDGLGANTSPLGTWSTAAALVTDNLVLLQLASVLGVAGVGFVIAWTAAVLAQLLASRDPAAFRIDALALLVGLIAVAGFGTWRLATPSSSPTVTVAGVVTDVGFGPDGLPSPDTLADNVDTLFERSAQAAERGARLIVWNEGATAVTPEEAPALVARGQAFSREHGVDLVLAFIIVTDPNPLAFENLAIFLDDHGEVLTRYHKRHPVPGETEPSDNPVPILERPYGTVSLAICYDADFPEMALAHASGGADLVAVPSSDWAGIDPVHTRMSRLLAIQGGTSVLRPVRWASSAAFDPMGRVRGWLRVDEDNDRVLLAELPTERVTTVYGLVGETPAGLAAVFLLGWVGLAGWRWWTTPRHHRGSSE